MTQQDLIFAIESAMDANGLESVLHLLADTVAEKANQVFGDMGYGLDPESNNEWDRAADMIRNVADSLPGSTR